MEPSHEARSPVITLLTWQFLLSTILLLWMLPPSVHGGHVYTDSFPTHDEYDVMALDPETPYGSPYGGFSRATASRLAALPLKLPNTGEDLHEFEPTYMTVRDSQGRPFICRVYHEDELEVGSLKDSLFDMPRLASKPGNSGSHRNGDDTLVITEAADETAMIKEGDEAKSEPLADEAADDEASNSDTPEIGSEVDDSESFPYLAKSPDNPNQNDAIPTDVDVDAAAADNFPVSSSASDAVETSEGPTSMIEQHWKDDPILIAHEISQRLSKLVGLCAQLHPNWWSYEWCHQEKVTQFHVQMGTGADITIPSGNQKIQQLQLLDVTSLGTYSERKILTSFDLLAEEKESDSTDKEGTKKKKNTSELDFAEGRKDIGRVIDTFVDGDVCPETRNPRQTEVTLQCCSERILAKTKGGVLKNDRLMATDLVTIARAREAKDAICHYRITVCTPLLCDDVDPAAYFDSESTAAPPKSAGATGISRKSDLVGSKDGKKKTIHPDLDPAAVEKLSITEVLEASFGKRGSFCFQAGTGGWWVYEFCPGEYIRQFHEGKIMDPATGQVRSSIETEHILGRFDAADHASMTKEDEWKNVVNATDSNSGTSSGGKNKSSRQARTRAPSITGLGGNGAYYFQEYTKGDLCDHEDVTDSAIKAGAFGEGEIERATTVRYSCGSYLEMSVKEDSTCHYIVDISVPALCHHPLFKAPVSKRQVVKCLPLESE